MVFGITVIKMIYIYIYIINKTSNIMVFRKIHTQAGIYYISRLLSFAFVSSLSVRRSCQGNQSITLRDFGPGRGTGQPFRQVLDTA